MGNYHTETVVRYDARFVWHVIAALDVPAVHITHSKWCASTVNSFCLYSTCGRIFQNKYTFFLALYCYVVITCAYFFADSSISCFI